MEITHESYLGASPEAIRHHYDLSNEFYRLWLDSTHTYSCALWEPGEEEEDLRTAQLRKLDYHIDQAQAHGAARVLDIGCGWGSLLARLVEHGTRQAVGLTLSSRQKEWIESSRADPRLEVRLENWIDHMPREPYDAIVSIAAMEAFARPGLSVQEKQKAYAAFFSRCRQWLKPAGRLSIQTIAWGNTRKEQSSQFIETLIFPESDLPSLAEIAEASQPFFEVVTLRNDRMDYERTCRAWLSRLEANRSAAVELVGEEDFQRYEKYLKICIIGFHTGKINLLRASFRRIDSPAWM